MPADAARGFEDFDEADVRDLIAGHPLAWVVSGDAVPPAASPLPLIGAYDEAGRLVALIGHLARRNPLFKALSANPRALILCQGPQGYVSPEHALQPGWAPTWNYAQLTIEAELVFDERETERSLDTLIAPMERGRATPWTSREMGARYTGMLGAIIGFRASVVSVRGTFKLGQDERVETLQTILDRHPNKSLTAWMRRMNAGRLLAREA